MAMQGGAFLGIWHNLKPGTRRDFDRWHTYEHMPERIGVPGFVGARRYTNWGLVSHACFTMYEGAHVETFRSPGYLARLNDPTPWSLRVGATQTDFLRGAFALKVSLGSGIGGALGTFRLRLSPSDRDAATLALRHRCEDAMDLHGVIAVHLGVAHRAITGVRTKEMEIRPNAGPQNALDAVVLLETIGLEELEAILADMQSLLRIHGVESIDAEPYRLAYLLTS
jgi:hypothetical protein